MHFVPIPTTHEQLRLWKKHWLPFLPKISQRSKEPVDQLLDEIASQRVQIGLAWDGERAHALIGIQFRKNGNVLIGELIWATGEEMKEWRDLLGEVERFLREHYGCNEVRPICRPGWSRMLKERGYKLTHYVMEKSL